MKAQKKKNKKNKNKNKKENQNNDDQPMSTPAPSTGFGGLDGVHVADINYLSLRGNKIPDSKAIARLVKGTGSPLYRSNVQYCTTVLYCTDYNHSGHH